MAARVKIDKGIPVPEYHQKVTFRDYPFADLRVGDSFHIEGFTEKQVANVTFNRGRNGKKFAYRLDDTGFRIWRVK
jgi:hypothetical protein